MAPTPEPDGDPPHERHPSSGDDTDAHAVSAHDTGTDTDAACVPITAPGQGPRDLFLPTTDDRRTRSETTPTASAPTDTATHDAATRGDRFLDDTDAADPLLAGHAELAPGAGEPGHLVGHDRLADVITTFGSTLEAIRAAQGRAPRHNLPTGSGTNQKRIAQVVQATPIDATRVVELIRSGTLASPRLALDTDEPAVGRGDVVFPGRLRMPGGTRRRVELRVYPTASGNLTVLELLPRRSWMPQTRRYLRAGVPAITTLSDAIEATAAAPTGRAPTERP